jgi:hypothetical protein
MKNLILLCCCCLVFCCSVEKALAQSDTTYQYKDKLYLKDGSALLGQLLSYTTNEQLIWGFSPKSVQYFSMSNVLKVVQAEPPTASVSKPVPTYQFSERGWYHTANVSFNIGKSSNSTAALGVGLSIGTGRQFQRWLGVGAVGSYNEYYLFRNGFSQVVSLGAEVRGYLSKRWSSPYYTCTVGYGLPFGNTKDSLLQNRNGGLSLLPTIGYRFGAYQKVNWTIDLGFQYQNIGLRETFSGDYYTDYNVGYRRWVLRVGVIF